MGERNLKTWIICSKAFYGRIPPIKAALEAKGHEIVLPNSYDHPTLEQESWDKSPEEHVRFKQRMFALSKGIAGDIDAALVLNYEKHGVPNYIGGATFLEIYEAFCANKKIYLMNEIPEGMLYDELQGMNPVVIHEDLSRIE